MRRRSLLAAAPLGWALAGPIAVAAPQTSGWAPPPGTLPRDAGAPPAPAPETAEPPDPAAARADHEIGLQRLNAGELGEAVERFKSAVARDPSRALYLNDLGFALARLGARREAEAVYQRALALEPGDWTAYGRLADLVAASGERWQRRDEINALLVRGASAVRADERGRQLLALAAARFERSVGRVSQARQRLEALLRETAAPAVKKLASDLLTALAEEERALALGDWPPAPLPDSARAALTEVGKLLDEQRPAEALTRATTLSEAHPASGEARFLRARALSAVARYDLAIRELTVLLQLQPSHAPAWRLLGTLLGEHGGALERDRADEALRRALALEPSWHDLRELRQRLRQSRVEIGHEKAPPSPRPGPTPRAQQLYDDAQRWMGSETPDLARAALAEALTESPGFVDAAASLYALGGQVPAATVTDLWSDGDGLGRLAGELLRIRQDAETTELVRPWLDRAVALGSAEARFTRALLRAELADHDGALVDLAAYVSGEVNPPRLAEARALRRSLAPNEPGHSAEVALARQLLLSDRPREAVRALGGACRPGLPAEVLIELGRIEEYEARPRPALACHRLALATGESGQRSAALERIARIAADAPVEELKALAPELIEANGANIPSAAWALARLAQQEERWQAAATLAERVLATAPPGDPLRLQAERASPDWRARSSEEQRTRAWLLRLGIAGGGGLLLVGLTALLLRRWRGRTVAGALARAPELFPDVAAVVAEVRHDVLKHRASALGMLGVSVTAREEIARTLREPVPTSAVVAAGYDRLRRAAAGMGVALRPLEREPLFGPLWRDLARAERLIDRPANGAALAALDRDLRERHGPALASLLALVPRTRLDPAQLAGWLRTVAEAAAAADHPERGPVEDPAPALVTPALELPASEVELPLPREALHTILANLVRNALRALDGAADPRVLVRVEQQRDATGRRLVSFLVADSAAGAVTLDQIEQRDGQRGLGIVRELVRRWGGHLVVQEEAAPFTKAIGASFPLLPAAGSL